MSDVASLELCKELYELSGWKPEGTGYEYAHNVYRFNGEIKAYLYTLGYLLRKLPKGCSVFRTVSSDEVWIATAGMKRLDDFYSGSDTPENAACKLTIELFKQGVLK